MAWILSRCARSARSQPPGLSRTSSCSLDVPVETCAGASARSGRRSRSHRERDTTASTSASAKVSRTRRVRRVIACSRRACRRSACWRALRESCAERSSERERAAFRRRRRGGSKTLFRGVDVAGARARLSLHRTPGSGRRRSRGAWRNRCSASRPRRASSGTMERALRARSFAARALTIPIFSSTRECSRSAIATRRRDSTKATALGARTRTPAFDAVLQRRHASVAARRHRLCDARCRKRALEVSRRAAARRRHDTHDATPGRLLADDPFARHRGAIPAALQIAGARDLDRHALRRQGCRAGRIAERRKRDSRARDAGKRGGVVRAQVARWFFESVGGKSPQDSWATRETLDEGLETIKTLVRDWIVASGTTASRWSRSTRPIAYAG